MDLHFTPEDFDGPVKASELLAKRDNRDGKPQPDAQMRAAFFDENGFAEIGPKELFAILSGKKPCPGCGEFHGDGEHAPGKTHEMGDVTIAPALEFHRPDAVKMPGSFAVRLIGFQPHKGHKSQAMLAIAMSMAIEEAKKLGEQGFFSPKELKAVEAANDMILKAYQSADRRGEKDEDDDANDE